MHRFWCLVILLCCAQRLRGDVLSVPVPYGTIQSAIDAAIDGDTITVSPGTYIENIDFKGKSIAVQSTDPNDPDVVAATIIDGSNPSDPNFGSVVIFRNGEDANSVLAGFTITGGTGSWLLVAWDLHQIYWNRCGGGAVCCNLSQPTITKNVFSNNFAGEGGAIYIYGNPVDPNNPSNPPVHLKPVITDNIFTDNAAKSYTYPPPPNDYNATVHGDGGAIVGFQGVDATIIGNSIIGNHAQAYGGGIHLRQWSNGLIAENDIADNNSALGAGIHLTYTSSPTITDNLIKGNIATGLGGGGIYIYAMSKPLVERNIITQNTAPGNGPGIGVYWQSTPTIRNNLIYKNNSGASIRIVSSTPIISNNTITRNVGGISTFSGANPVIKNNIIASNGVGYGIYVSSGDSPVITYNDVWGHKAGYNYGGGGITDQTGVNGNISEDPNFVNPDANNYHIDPNSPCINAGDPSYTAEPNQTDIDAEQRIFDSIVDMGADEMLTNPFDLDTNGVVGYPELETLTNEWLWTVPELQTDFNEDGIVNFADFAEFTSHGVVGYPELETLTNEWLWTVPELQTDFNEDEIVNFADFAEFASQWLWTAGWYH